MTEGRRLSEGSALAIGRIERVSADRVTGWAVSPSSRLRPVVTVNGRPGRRVEWPVPRPDVADAVGVTGLEGFEFEVEGVRTGDRIELHGIVGTSMHRLHSMPAPAPALELGFLRQLARARELAEDPRTVAITCWESGHNPLGRAKVLYDTVSTRRPAVLLAYSFLEFGAQVWSPLLDTDLNLLVIPWEQREGYHRLMRREGLRFSTVWMCKNRYPTFELAAQISDENTRLILDLDDNEDHFAQSEGSFVKPYGLPGIGLSRAITDKIRARTVASATLQQRFGGVVVRHARQAGSRRRKVPFRAQTSPSQAARVGFVGTVRPHKNIVQAAQAVAMTRWLYERDIEFQVHGDVSPPSLRDELLANGAVVGDMVASTDLPDVLAGLDCVITGFPIDGTFDDVTRFQISSKIGDALAAGIPVMVPRGPSVADLEGVRGVFLFDTTDFAVQLKAALDLGTRIDLPREFTMQAAYEGFETAEAEAAAARTSPCEAFADIRADASTSDAPAGPSGDHRNLLLVWKQLDAGLYGRRVDQVARAYKRAHPAARVTVLELANGSFGKLAERAGNYYSDARLVGDALKRKLVGAFTDGDGVEYRCLDLGDGRGARSVFETFLVDEHLVPSNTTVVLFPLVPFYQELRDVLVPFTKVADVVDNQFSWSTTEQAVSESAEQYHLLLRSVDAVCFNSEDNLAHFNRLGMLPSATPTEFIANWYALPAGVDVAGGRTRSDDTHLVYSGNMSDRVDWGLLTRVATLPSRPWLHLVGGAERSPRGPLRRLLSQERVIYHGPMDEQRTLQLLSGADLAVMPHLVDNHSTFMNPMKVGMYTAVGLPVVTTHVPGLPSDLDQLTVVKHRRNFVATVERVLEERRALQPREDARQKLAQQYVAFLEALATREETPIRAAVRR